MRRGKAFLFFAIAMFAALVICQAWKPMPYVEKLIRIQAEQELAHIDNGILSEPLEIQSVLLDYAAAPAEGKVLVLKAWIALSKYRETARDILSDYGDTPEFREILLRYGEAVIPVIQYFRNNDVFSVAAIDATASAVQSVRETAGTLWNRVSGNSPVDSKAEASARPRALGSTERGWYAVNFIRNEGNDFLGQFAVLGDKTVKWNQTDRALKAITSFFTSGLRALETKYDVGDVRAADLGWAALDIAVIAAPLKLFRAGKLVTASGENVGLATRTAIFAPRLLPRARIFQIGKFGLIAATAYVVLAHPGLINSALGETASLLGLNPWVVQFAGWFLIIGVGLYPFAWLLQVLARLLLGGFSLLERLRRRGTSGTP